MLLYVQDLLSVKSCEETEFSAFPSIFLYNFQGYDLLEYHAAAAAKSLQSCPTLCNSIDGSPPSSPVPGILQARTLECQCMKEKSGREVTQLCPTLRDPIDCSLPGSSVHGIFQARVLEWGAIAFSSILLTFYCGSN